MKESLCARGALIALSITFIAYLTVSVRASVSDPQSLPLDTGGITAIGLTAGPCTGNCPVYKLTIRRGDRAHLTGDLPDGRSGSFIALVDFDRIAQWVATQNFSEHKPVAILSVSDKPTERFTITRNGRQIVLANDGSAPSALLFGLRGVLDDVIAKADWQPDTAKADFLGYYVAGHGRAGVAIVPNAAHQLVADTFSPGVRSERWSAPIVFKGTSALATSGSSTTVIRIAAPDRIDVVLDGVSYLMERVDRRTFNRLLQRTGT
ncbi:MAG TPA: hypothetical protein VFW34_08675 [Candidatus Rubrimentiphilum sp.]|nr:hypothetical protein [Candidatus Rubrimentiphilum sp.]